MMYQMQHHKQIWERKQEMDALEREPDSLENQRKIEEMIKQKGIIENYELAMEEAPEVFGRVHMLYIDVEVQGHRYRIANALFSRACRLIPSCCSLARVKAFVDSGAQSTIMSAKCAEECGLHNLIDVRYAGEARGVGTCKCVTICMSIALLGQHAQCAAHPSTHPVAGQYHLQNFGEGSLS
jgi:DNA damage-inducible protein 1